jgi:hypothetical protein
MLHTTELKDKYEAMTIQELRDLLIEKNMNIPKSWSKLPFYGYIMAASNKVLLTVRKDNSPKKLKNDEEFTATIASKNCKPPTHHLDVGDLVKLVEIQLQVGPDLIVEDISDLDPLQNKHLPTIPYLLSDSDDDEKDPRKHKKQKPPEFVRGTFELQDEWEDIDRRECQVLKQIDAPRKNPYAEMLIGHEMAGKNTSGVYMNKALLRFTNSWLEKNLNALAAWRM